MKVDRYYDPYEDLERKCLEELDYIAASLGGKLTKSTQNYRGRISKVVTIEYDVHE